MSQSREQISGGINSSKDIYFYSGLQFQTSEPRQTFPMKVVVSTFVKGENFEDLLRSINSSLKDGKCVTV